MENKQKTSIFKSRRFKYGSLAVGLTVALVVLVILLNAATYALTYSFGWYLDLTGNQYYGITPASKNMLDGVLVPGVEVQIVFCQDKDEVIADDGGFYVYKCVESYKEAYPNNISVKFLDINKHPELAAQYTSQLGTKLYTYNIIVETNMEKAGLPNIRVVDYDDFFVFDSDTNNVYAFNGENRLTSYILSICHSFPKCYFIAGHKETITNPSNREAYCDLYYFMQDAGYDVSEKKLTDDEISDAAVVVINDPVSDFEFSELDKLGRFISDERGQIMVFLSPDNALSSDPSKPKLPNLTQWLNEWGIKIGGQISDTTGSLTGSDGLSILATYPIPPTSDDEDKYVGQRLASSLHTELRNGDSQPQTVIDNALSFECVWKENTDGTRIYGDVLYSRDTASVGDIKNRQFGMASLVSKGVWNDKSESIEYNYLFVTSVGYTNYITSQAYGNRDIISKLASAMGKEQVPSGIAMKVFGSEVLSISQGAARAWTVVLVGVVPVAVLTVGAVVVYRRKRK